MLLKPVHRFSKIQSIMRYSCNKSFHLQYESVCCTKLPSVMNKAIHTSQANYRDYTFKPYKAPPHEQHDYKNMRLRRPMSPHLTIYAPTLPAMTSIAQRITGATLTFFAIMLSGGALFLSNGIDSYVSMIQSLNLNRFSIFLIKLIAGYPFCYHYFCGIRFCMFNALRLLDKNQVYSSGKQAIVASAVLALLFAMR